MDSPLLDVESSTFPQRPRPLRDGSASVRPRRRAAPANTTPGRSPTPRSFGAGLLALLVGAGLVCGAAGTPEVQARCSDPFDRPDEVLTFHLRMSAKTWADLASDSPDTLTSPEDDCEQFPYRDVQFRCGDEGTWLRIGARRKAGASVPNPKDRFADLKPSLKLDFNQYVMGQRWPADMGKAGFKKLTLNNGQNTFDDEPLQVLLTEHMGWRFLHEEVPDAGRSAYAQLFVHFDDKPNDPPVFGGLYIVVEEMDRTALEKRFGTSKGRLVKVSGAGKCNGVRHDDVVPNPTTEAAEAILALQRPDGADFTTRLDKAFDMDTLLRQEAVRQILGDTDSIFGQFFNNYLAFDPPNGKRHYLPWDIDRMFLWSASYPLEADCTNPIARLMLCQDDVYKRYLQLACQMLSGTMRPERLSSEFSRVDAIIRPLIEKEVNEIWKGGQNPLSAQVGGSYEERFQELSTYFQDRAAAIRGGARSAGVDCPDRCATGATESCRYLTCSGQRKCVDGVWTSCQPQGSGCEDVDGVRDTSIAPAGPGAGPGAPGGGQPGSGSSDTRGAQGCSLSGSGLGPSPISLFVLLGLLVRRRARRPR
ncbi:MAG: CotH kinase family protein [Myxococcales bacterium]|nr:CotH kinase family protein [Myxococcales bacterium]